MAAMTIAPSSGASNPTNLAPASTNDSASNGQSFSSTLNQQIKSQAQDAQSTTASAKPADPGKNAKDSSQTDNQAAQAQGQTDSQAAAASAMASLLPMLPALPIAVQTTVAAKDPHSKATDAGDGTTAQAALLALGIGVPAQAAPLAQSPTLSPATASATAGNAAGYAGGNALQGLGNSGKSSPVAAAGPAIVASSLLTDEKTAGAAVNRTLAAPTEFQNLLAAGQSALQAQQQVSTTTQAHSVSAMSTPFNAAGWSQEIGDRVVWMANQQNSRADLVLNPPQLGRVEISLTVNGDQATANFVSASPEVRDALNQAMPHLREVLAGAGIQLGQAQVGADSSSQWSNQQETRHNGGSSSRTAADGTSTTVSSLSAGTIAGSMRLRQGNGLVDAFA